MGLVSRSRLDGLEAVVVVMMVVVGYVWWLEDR